MDKSNPQTPQMLKFKLWYLWVRESRVSWRKKSSYRKPIKRRTSKMRRLGEKHIIRECYYEE